MRCQQRVVNEERVAAGSVHFQQKWTEVLEWWWGYKQ